MNASSDETPGGWSPMVIGSIVIGAVLLLLLIPTFRSPAPQVNAPANGTTGGEDVTQSQCERTLMSAMEGLEPNRLGISSETRVMVDTLNNWLTQCVADDAPIVDSKDQQLREQLLTAQGFQHSQNERFQPRDAEHVRNSLLAAAIVERVAADLKTDRERALALFYYVVRTLDLLPVDAPELLLTPYESLVFGMGTAADRGWTYALLMRQLRLDVVMIQPRGRPETTYWLLGAIVPGEGVLLLDPRLGLPLTAIADIENPQTPLPEQAATLADVRQNGQLLRQFDRDEREYPLTAEDLSKVDVYAIGTSSTFAPRIGLLQASLVEPVELFDGLGSNELRETGLIDRVVLAGDGGLWNREQVHVWPYPEQYWSDSETMTDEQKQHLANVQAVFSGPFSIAITMSVNEQDQLQLGTKVEKPQRTLLEARIEQLLGNFAGAQQAYLQTRLNQVNLGELPAYFTTLQQTLAEEVENPQEAQQTYQAIQQQVMQEVNRQMQSVPERQLNVIAADMATYWAAQAQYEQQDYRLAAESALAYVARGGGSYFMSAIYLASLSLAQDGRPVEALELAARQPPEASPSLGYLTLVDRWRKLSRQKPSADLPDSEEKPAEGKPTSPADSENEKPPQPEPASDAKPSEASESEKQPPADATPTDESDDTNGVGDSGIPDAPQPDAADGSAADAEQATNQP